MNASKVSKIKTTKKIAKAVKVSGRVAAAPKAGKKAGSPVLKRVVAKRVAKPVSLDESGAAKADGEVAKRPRVQSVSASAKVVTTKLRAVNTIPVDMAVDSSMRPLCGNDVERFRSRHRLLIPDMTYMLALQSGSQYNKLASSPLPLPYAAEFMIRVCDAYPTPPPWTNLSMHEAFDMLYGPTLKQFEDEHPELVDHARVVLYYRFTALFGRSSFSGYRWIENEGAAKRSLYRVVAKIFERQDPLRTAEEMARLIWRVRGVEFDQAFPMPSTDNISTDPRRGRLPGAAARKAAIMQAADARGNR